LKLSIVQVLVIAVCMGAVGSGLFLTAFIIMLEGKEQGQLLDTKIAVIGGTLIMHVVLPIASTIFILQFIPER
jgi:hypothetical protein